MAFQLLDSSPVPVVATGTRDEDAPAKIGKYRVLGTLGEGGMSIVYRARDEALDRVVALKLLHRHLARDPEARARFTREARAVARLTHRNIPEIYDFSGAGPGDEAGGRAFIVSELVDGAPLSRLLRDGIAYPEIGLAIAMGVGQALVHAHAHAVIHRDVKPENVLVGKDGVVKLTDFGIAQVSGLESMTMTGTLIGSPAHMAPEQIDGTKDLDARVDVWGFGTILYMAATGGKLPFEADNAHHLLRKVASGDYADPRRASPHVDAELTGIVRRCLTVDRAARYPDMESVLRDVASWLATRGVVDCEREVKAFMADPRGYTRLFGERLESTFMRLGDEAAARGETSLALERYGRILAIDPDHDLALERVRRLERRLRNRRRLAYAALGVAGAAGVAATIVFAQPGPTTPAVGGGARLGALTGLDGPPAAPRITPRPAPPEVVPPSAPATWGAGFGAALDDELTRLAERPEPARPDKPPKDPRDKDPRGTDRPDVKPRPALVAVHLTAYPPAVRITVAGKTLATPADIQLAPGTYQVVLTHPTRPDLAPDPHSLVVPEGAAATGLSPETFTFREHPRANETTTLFVRCRAAGNYARDMATGKHYACNVTHTLPVEAGRAKTIALALYDKDGQLVEGQRIFNVNSTQSIVW